MRATSGSRDSSDTEDSTLDLARLLLPAMSIEAKQLHGSERRLVPCSDGMAWTLGG